MTIGLAQLNFHVGNIEVNTSKIIRHSLDLFNQGCDLVVFPELAICGYPPLDILEYEHFVDQCLKALNEIALHIPMDHAVIVGSPAHNPNKGKPLINAAFLLTKDTVRMIHGKNLLPDYDVFDEYRHFQPQKNLGVIQWKDKTIAVTICEDLWEEKECVYDHSVQSLIKDARPDIILNISASPFHLQHFTERFDVMSKNAREHNCLLIHVNQTGANTDLIFDGRSLIMYPAKNLFWQGPAFGECTACIDTDTLKLFSGEYTNFSCEEEELYHALICGIKDFFDKNRFSKAVLGLSGGIDSALVYVLLCHAIGKENVKAILLPSPFSSQSSIDDALQLIGNLQGDYDIFPIHSIYQEINQTLSKQWQQDIFDITQENIQARIRGMILMAYSNRYGYILINTTNKSEMAVGYGTLYGDMCGALSVIGDLYKTTVYRLSYWINRNFENIIPDNILQKAPSAELRPGQKDVDSLPPYEILDLILKDYLEDKKSPEEISKNHHLDFNIVNEICQKVNANEFKRFQAPPVLRVTKKAFGWGRRIPLVSKWR